MSNDYAYAESLFRTAKYRPLRPDRPFNTLEQARDWVHRFGVLVQRGSGLKYVTPNQRHRGEATPLLARRTMLYQAARARHPQRWSRGIRNGKLEPVVYLNPERAELEAKEHRKAA